MKEIYTSNKVALINNAYSDGTLKKLEKERLIANIMNKLHREIIETLKEHEQKMIRIAEKLLRENI